MADTKKNNTANVSAAKGIAGGYFFSAKLGTALPEDCTTALTDDYECIGYISEDGYVETVDEDSDSLSDMNGDEMDTTHSGRSESAQVTLAEIKAATLKRMYGDGNVTDDKGMITVRHNGDSHSSFVYVLELLLKNGRRWRKVVPIGQSDSLDDLTISSSELASRPLTLKYLPYAGWDGDTCRDYIESTETTKAGA